MRGNIDQKCVERGIPYGFRMGKESQIVIKSKKLHKSLTILCVVMAHGKKALDEAQQMMEEEDLDDEESVGDVEEVLEKVDSVMEGECETCQTQYSLDRMFIDGRYEDLMDKNKWYMTLLQWKSLLKKYSYCVNIDVFFYPDPHRVDDIIEEVEALHNQPTEFVFQMRYRNNHGKWKYFIKGQGATFNILNLLIN